MRHRAKAPTQRYCPLRSFRAASISNTTSLRRASTSSVLPRPNALRLGLPWTLVNRAAK
jgi:hypothetical protein